MASVFLGSLMCVPYNFAPAGFAFCRGQLMPISQNTALFSLLGTTYGGDGKSTFALPDLQGRVSISSGQGPGLQLYDLGEMFGEETVTLLQSEIPLHTHQVFGTNQPATTAQPGSGLLGPAPVSMYNTSLPSLDATLSFSALSVAGGSLPHENRMPYLTLNWIIALSGIFPSRP
jgi:microcystin-dependent protein